MLWAEVAICSEEIFAEAEELSQQVAKVRQRFLVIDAVPIPVHPMLRAAAASINFLTAAPRGLALDYGIFIRADHWRDHALIAHELVHTAQFQRLGGILPFLQTYIFQCATVGCQNAPLELEAVATAARVCSA